jgi:Ca2+-binding EF-hand superfamily protein
LGAEVDFYQVNFKTQTELCYQQRVFNFPTVHFYLPSIGRVARLVLTASNTDEKMGKALSRLRVGQRQLKQISASAISPVVQYTELVGALQGLADVTAQAQQEVDASGFGAGVNVKKESARLRTMVEGDEQRLHELETLFRSLDEDADGRLDLNELEGAVKALQPEGSAGEAAGALLERLSADSDEPIFMDEATFVSMMVDKAVHDFASGEKALMPAFEALDADGDGTVSQQDLLAVIDNFCDLRPDAEGCSIDHRPLRLSQAFSAFANDEQLLDYERFVEMVSGRTDAFGEECKLVDEEAQAKRAAYLAELDEMNGERECFGEAVIEETNEDDVACDAWFYGEDPTVEKVVKVVDQVKIDALRADGERMRVERAKREVAMAALLAAKS